MNNIYSVLIVEKGVIQTPEQERDATSSPCQYVLAEEGNGLFTLLKSPRWIDGKPLSGESTQILSRSIKDLTGFLDGR